MRFMLTLQDLTGGVLSLLQLVISSVFIAHDPSGIIANPVKLGLSIQSIVFDLIFLVQKLYLYRDAKDPAFEDEDETLGSSS
jgi:cystinosin